jgi:two-component system OmpR family sensor kinase
MGSRHYTVIDFSGTSVGVDPAIPAALRAGQLLTVNGENGDDERYRVYADATPGGGLTVVALPLRETDSNLERLVMVEALVIAGVLLVLAAVAWALVRIGLLPLDRMTETAGRIAGGDLSHRVEMADGRSEVGRLGLAFNRMLDRLEGAFAEREQSEERLRRFVADASHELRTPLASIRGYAELFRMGAATDAAAVARSMQRIEEEATRMGVLVEDLLTLARLDQVAHARQDEVELAALARDSADDARATAPDRTVTVREEEPAVVRGDADQLRQVVANLTRNALLHTPAGTPNELSVPAGRLTVRDHGPGLPADDASAIFERFWRAEGGRARQERSRARPGDRGRDRRRPRRSSPRAQRAGRRRGVRRRAAQGHGPVFARLRGPRPSADHRRRVIIGRGARSKQQRFVRGAAGCQRARHGQPASRFQDRTVRPRRWLARRLRLSRACAIRRANAPDCAHHVPIVVSLPWVRPATGPSVARHGKATPRGNCPRRTYV